MRALMGPPDPIGAAPGDGSPARGVGTAVLVRRARARDEEAWRELVRRHRALLTFVIRSKLPEDVQRRVAAEDVLQSALASAFAEIESFRDQGPGSFLRWLKTIALNRLHDQVDLPGRDKRSVGRERALATDLWLAVADPTTRAPADAAARAEEIVHLFEAMDELSEPGREVLFRRHFDGLEWAEIARRSSLEARAARAAYGRAVAELARKLRSRRGPSAPAGT
jgi:RNA polymerase sigma factor (sigma-70 family)